MIKDLQLCIWYNHRFYCYFVFSEKIYWSRVQLDPMSSPDSCPVFTLKYLNFHCFLLVLQKTRKLKPHSLMIWKNSARQMIIRILLPSLPVFFWFSFLNLQKRRNLFSVNLNPLVLEIERNTQHARKMKSTMPNIKNHCAPSIETVTIQEEMMPSDT